MTASKDIQSKTDIEALLTAFYDKVLKNELLSPKFSHINLEEHLPLIVDFWSSILLHDQSYHGNPFDKHLSLELKSEHFSLWLALFSQTVDEMFAGKVAEEAKFRANSIAGIFKHKLGLS